MPHKKKGPARPGWPHARRPRVSPRARIDLWRSGPVTPPHATDRRTGLGLPPPGVYFVPRGIGGGGTAGGGAPGSLLGVLGTKPAVFEPTPPALGWRPGHTPLGQQGSGEARVGGAPSLDLLGAHQWQSPFRTEPGFHASCPIRLCLCCRQEHLCVPVPLPGQPMPQAAPAHPAPAAGRGAVSMLVRSIVVMLVMLRSTRSTLST